MKLTKLCFIILIITIISCNKNKIVENNKKVELDSLDNYKTKPIIEIGSLDNYKTAPLFSLPDQYGNMIHLDDFKGKFLLIDFWASWCPPCRKENPNLVKLYKKYNPKGLAFLSISLDGLNNDENGKKKWVNAIIEDQLNWINVSELKGWNSEIVNLYNITNIPHTVLIDKKGNIIAEKVFGKKLEHEIEKMMK